MTTIPRAGADILALAPVMPVVVVTDADTAVPLARALVEGGVPAIEVTLRTPAALGAIEQITAEVPGAVVGAGTVVTNEQADAAAKAGARFLVSPGCTPDLVSAMADTALPFLPGTGTASGPGSKHGRPRNPANRADSESWQVPPAAVETASTRPSSSVATCQSHGLL